MTTTELSQRVYVTRTSSHGHYKVEITYRGKQYTCTTTNSMAFDAHDDEDAKGHYTQREALQSLWDECKRANKIR